MMRKVVFLCVAVILLVGSTALAVMVDLPPAWRGQEGSTCQGWSFDTDEQYPSPDMVLPGSPGNPYGDPFLTVGNYWFDVIDGHQGVWGLSGVIDVYIPNQPEPQVQKWIWLQLIWKPAELCDGPLPDALLISVIPFDFMTMYRVADEDMGDGWWHTVFNITLYPNPPDELISIRGDVLVDSLIIDTICIPEPPMILLLGLGGLALLRKH